MEKKVGEPGSSRLEPRRRPHVRSGIPPSKGFEEVFLARSRPEATRACCHGDTSRPILQECLARALRKAP